jgi:hypothetical protein
VGLAMGLAIKVVVLMLPVMGPQMLGVTTHESGTTYYLYGVPNIRGKPVAALP